MSLRTLVLVLVLAALPAPAAAASSARTVLSIQGDRFLVNGVPTHAGRRWVDAGGTAHDLSGLLLNARMANGIFDDANPATRSDWRYPDTQRWDPERNTDELISALPAYRAAGLAAIGVNLQGGSPTAYGSGPWIDTTIRPDGTLDAA